MPKPILLESLFIVPDTSCSTFITVALLRRMDGSNHAPVNDSYCKTVLARTFAGMNFPQSRWYKPWPGARRVNDIAGTIAANAVSAVQHGCFHAGYDTVNSLLKQVRVPTGMARVSRHGRCSRCH